MLKIKDRIMHGIVTGILAGTPDTLLNMAEYRLGLTDLKYEQIGANIFLPQEKLDDRKARLTGMLANYTMIGASGVLFSYLLYLTGKDKALIKGIGFGVFSWLLVYGMGKRFGLGIKTGRPLSPLLSFIDHVLFGSLLGFIAPRIGDDSLFP